MTGMQSSHLTFVHVLLTSEDIRYAFASAQRRSRCTNRSQPQVLRLAFCKPRLLDHVRGAIRMRHYSYRTEEAYVGWIERFIPVHGKRHPAEMGAVEVSQYLSSLATDGHVSGDSPHKRGN